MLSAVGDRGNELLTILTGNTLDYPVLENLLLNLGEYNPWTALKSARIIQVDPKHLSKDEVESLKKTGVEFNDGFIRGAKSNTPLKNKAFIISRSDLRSLGGAALGVQAFRNIFGAFLGTEETDNIIGNAVDHLDSLFKEAASRKPSKERSSRLIRDNLEIIDKLERYKEQLLLAIQNLDHVDYQVLRSTLTPHLDLEKESQNLGWFKKHLETLPPEIRDSYLLITQHGSNLSSEERMLILEGLVAFRSLKMRIKKDAFLQSFKDDLQEFKKQKEGSPGRFGKTDNDIKLAEQRVQSIITSESGEMTFAQMSEYLGEFPLLSFRRYRNSLVYEKLKKDLEYARVSVFEPLSIKDGKLSPPKFRDLKETELGIAKFPNGKTVVSAEDWRALWELFENRHLLQNDPQFFALFGVRSFKRLAIRSVYVARSQRLIKEGNPSEINVNRDKIRFIERFPQITGLTFENFDERATYGPYKPDKLLQQLSPFGFFAEYQTLKDFAADLKALRRVDSHEMELVMAFKNSPLCKNPYEYRFANYSLRFATKNQVGAINQALIFRNILEATETNSALKAIFLKILSGKFYSFTETALHRVEIDNPKTKEEFHKLERDISEKWVDEESLSEEQRSNLLKLVNNRTLLVVKPYLTAPPKVENRYFKKEGLDSLAEILSKIEEVSDEVAIYLVKYDGDFYFVKGKAYIHGAQRNIKGMKVQDVPEGYINWVLEQPNVPESVKDILRKSLTDRTT